MENVPSGSTEAMDVVGQVDVSQSGEPQKIADPEKLLKLLRTEECSDELYKAAVDVMRELNVLKIEKENLEKLEQENQEKIINLNRSNAVLEQEKDTFKSYCRRLLCPSIVKLSMNFTNSHLPDDNPVFNRQSEIDEKVLEVANEDSRAARLFDYVQRFLSLSMEAQDRIEVTFPTIWNDMKIIPIEENPQVAERIRNNDLSRAVIKLFEAANEEEALHIFNEQKSKVWQPRMGTMSGEDHAAIDAMNYVSPDVGLDLVRRVCPLLSTGEEQYIRDRFEMGPRFAARATKQYQRCLWALYTSDKAVVKNICRQLEEKGLQMERSRRMHIYASSFSKLFDIVSCHDVLGHPRFTDHPFPTKEEYRQFCQFLKTSQSPEIAFVAETVYMPE